MIASGSRFSQYVKADVEENPIISLTNNLSRVSLCYKWIVDKHTELCPVPASLPRSFSIHYYSPQITETETTLPIVPENGIFTFEASFLLPLQKTINVEKCK